MNHPLVFASIFLGLTGLFALIAYGIGVAIKKQAERPNKRFFTTVPTPATFVFQVLEGNVIRVIDNVDGWHLDKQNRFNLDTPSTPKKDFGFWAQSLGVIWIGLFNTIKIFEDWVWPEFRQKLVKENGEDVVKYEIIGRKKDVSEFRFQFTYSVRIEKIELAGNIQANINTVFTVFFLSPKRAVYLNKDPVDLFIAMVRSAVRAWMNNKDFNTIKQITVSGDKSAGVISGFWQMLEELNGLEFNGEVSPGGPLRDSNQPKGQPLYDTEKPRGIYGKLGIAIVRVELEQVEAVGAAAQALEATKINELQGDAEIMKEQKAAAALITKAKGEATAMNERREARKQWVNDTIVTPTGGAGKHVTSVLVAEQYANPSSNVKVLGGNVMASVSSD